MDALFRTPVQALTTLPLVGILKLPSMGSLWNGIGKFDFLFSPFPAVLQESLSKEYFQSTKLSCRIQSGLELLVQIIRLFQP